MGMPIDEAIGELESTKDYPASDPASDEALDLAIATMRKYQKIEEIVRKTSNDDWIGRKIKKVLEDGTID